MTDASCGCLAHDWFSSRAHSNRLVRTDSFNRIGAVRPCTWRSRF